jgi:hypothetical protein
MMRKEEEYALEALVSRFGGEFSAGEDPPDAYLHKNGQCVAVEVSMLVERITENGVTRSRIADEAPVTKISEELEAEIGDSIPNGRWLYLGLPCPIKGMQMFKKGLTQFAREIIADNEKSAERIISGNLVSIYYYSDRGEQERKVAQFVLGAQSFDKEQAKLILHDRITVKNRKIAKLPGTNECWLVLLNHYWPANIETYREVYKSYKGEHKFDKILIIDQHKRVEILAST